MFQGSRVPGLQVFTPLLINNNGTMEQWNLGTLFKVN
jgi:hypothetical protein